MPDVKHLCALAVYAPGGALSLLSTRGLVWLFDTVNVARNFAPILSDGRLVTWSPDEETCWFTPLRADLVNRVSIITNYDPYHLPAGIGVRSETKGMAWKSHVHYTDVFVDKGQFRLLPNGRMLNLALGEDVDA